MLQGSNLDSKAGERVKDTYSVCGGQASSVLTHSTGSVRAGDEIDGRAL